MTAKPPLLHLGGFSVPGLLEGLEAAYDLRTAPAPGIRAVSTNGGVGIDAATIDLMPDLEMIAVCAVGYDKVDVAHARKRGIALSYTPDVLTDDVADLALALMLAVFRKLPQQDAYVRRGDWAAKGPAPLTRKFSGSKVGILGLGRIGHAIARRVEPFGGDIAYHSRHARADVAYRYAASAAELAASVDVLVVATPGDASAHHLVDRTVLDALGPHGVLINIARGSVVDDDALVAALADGRLGGAGLDVFADEPHVPQALLDSDKVVLLPHQGSATVETRRAMGQLVIDNLAAHFAGQPLITPIP